MYFSTPGAQLVVLVGKVGEPLADRTFLKEVCHREPALRVSSIAPRKPEGKMNPSFLSRFWSRYFFIIAKEK